MFSKDLAIFCPSHKFFLWEFFYFFTNMEGVHVLGKQPRELDQFFTKPDIAQMCVAHLNKVFPISEFKSIIEPAHGNMAFVNALAEWKEVVVSMDIDAVDESKRKDFLTHTHTHTHTHTGCGKSSFWSRCAFSRVFF